MSTDGRWRRHFAKKIKALTRGCTDHLTTFVPTMNFRLAVTYLLFPVQVCFSRPSDSSSCSRYSCVTLNFGLLPWPLNETWIVSRWTSQIAKSCHLYQKLLTGHRHTLTRPIAVPGPLNRKALTRGHIDHFAAGVTYLYFGSRPSDHYFRSVCWFVCLSICLFVCAEFFSSIFDPISIKLGYMLYVWV